MINWYDGFNSRVVPAKEVGEFKQNRLVESKQTEAWWERMNGTKCKRSAKWDEVRITRSCLTLCDPVDCSLPGSSVHGILQVRILEWVSISSSRWSSLLQGIFPFPGDLPNSEIKPRYPALQMDSLLSEPPGKPGHKTHPYRWRKAF